jgi:hypothetical protein
MALIEIRADLSRLTKAVERIAELLERLVPEEPPPFEPSTEADFHEIGYQPEFPREDSDRWMTYAPRRNY